MKTLSSILYLFLILIQTLQAQENTPDSPSKLSRASAQYFSGYLGYQNYLASDFKDHAFALRVSVPILHLIYGDSYTKNSGMMLIIEGSYTLKHSFENPYLTRTQYWTTNTYNSDVNIATGLIGIGYESWMGQGAFVSPYFAIKYDFVEFNDEDLHRGFENRSISRYVNGEKVGKTLDKEYGDSKIGFEVGLRLGIVVSKNPKVAVVGTVSFSQSRFDDIDSYFGQYYGQTEIENDFDIQSNRNGLKFGLGARFSI